MSDSIKDRRARFIRSLATLDTAGMRHMLRMEPVEELQEIQKLFLPDRKIVQIIKETIKEKSK